MGKKRGRGGFVSRERYTVELTVERQCSFLLSLPSLSTFAQCPRKKEQKNPKSLRYGGREKGGKKGRV